MLTTLISRFLRGSGNFLARSPRTFIYFKFVSNLFLFVSNLFLFVSFLIVSYLFLSYEQATSKLRASYEQATSLCEHRHARARAFVCVRMFLRASYEQATSKLRAVRKPRPWRAHTMKNTAAVARRSRGVHGGLASVKPPDTTKAYQNVHSGQLAVHKPKGRGEMALPAFIYSFPDRVLASDQNNPLLVLYTKTDTKRVF